MTTANLRVGIDTSEAKESLRRLHAEMASQPHKLLINVDPSSVDRDIQRYLKQRTFKVSVNTKALGQEIANDVGIALDRAFAKEGRKVAFNQASLRGSLNAAIDGVFNDKERRLRYDRTRLVGDLRTSVDGALDYKHNIAINAAGLTAEVRAAVAAGLAGGVVKVAGVAPGQAAPSASQGLGPDLNTVLQRALAPAVNSLTQAALEIASVARKAGVSQAAGGPATAKESISTKDPVTGFTKSFSRRLENPELQLGQIQVANDAKAQLKQLAEAGERELATRGALVNQRIVEIGKAEAAVTEAVRRSEARAAATRAALVDQRVGEIGKAETSNLKALAQAEKRIADTRAALVNQRVAEVGKAETLAAKATSETEARIAATKAALVNQRVAEVGKAEVSGMKALAEAERRIAETRTALVNQRLTEIAKSEQAATKAAAEAQTRVSATKAALVNQRVDEVAKAEQAAAKAEKQTQDQIAQTRAALTNQRVSEIGRIEREGMAAQKAALIAFYEKAKFDAAKTFTGQGAAIAAAQATSQQFGRQSTLDFLGPKKGFLLDAVNELENYRRSSDKVTESHRKLTSATREAHSAVRGLASGFNAMYLTYGAVLPLLAGAAISKSFVSSMKDGMAVSQELATIKYLGGESTQAVQSLNMALLDTKANGPFGPREVATALKTLSLAGLDARQQLQALPAVLNFSISGQVSLEKSAETLVAVATAYGYTARDFSVVGDIITKAAASSMASVDSMSESFKAASVVAQQYKVSLEDTSITLALLSQVGIKGSAAGTAMRQMYSELAGSSRKARTILQDTLKIDVIDNATGAMRPLVEIIKDLSTALDRFDPKSQLRILQEMGNERGTKALSANLTALRIEAAATGKVVVNELERMQALMRDAPGFMAEASAGMALTAQNQFKGVGAALETSLVKAFQSIEPSVLQVSMRLKETFASGEFQQGLKNAITLVANFTTSLVTHASTIMEAVKAYLAWKAVTISFEIFRSLTTTVATFATAVEVLGMRSAISAVGVGGLNGALAATPAITAAAAAGMARLQVAMGWISLLATAVAAAVTWWILYKDKSVDASVSASQAVKAAAAATTAAMDEEIKSLKKQIELRKQGIEEQFIAQEQAAQIGLENIRNLGEQERAALKAAHAQNLLNAAKIADSPYGETAQGSRALVQANAAVAKSRDTLATSYYNQSVAETSYEEQRRTLRNLARQNAQEASAAAASRQKIKGGDEEFKGVPKERSDRSGHQQVLADIADIKSAYERSVKETEAMYQTQDVILKAKQSAGLISQEEYESRLTLISAQHSKRRVEMAAQEYDQIKSKVDSILKADEGKSAKAQRLSEPDRQKIERDLLDARQKAEEAATAEATRAAVAAIQLEGATKKAADHAREFQMTAAVRDMKALRDILASISDFEATSSSKRGPGATSAQEMYGSQYIDRISTTGMGAAQKEAVAVQREVQRRENFERSLIRKQANDSKLQGASAKDNSLKAAMAAYDEYATELLDLSKSLTKTEDQLTKLNSQRASLQEQINIDVTPAVVQGAKQELEALDSAAGDLRKRIDDAKKQINVVERMRQTSVDVRSDAARKAYDYERSAEAGFRSFWKTYSDEASNSAKLVNNVMSQSFSSMDQALSQFVTTGKLKFGTLVTSIIADAARAYANQWVRQLLGYAASAVSGYFSGGSANAAGGANSAGFGSGAGYGNQDLGANFAKGGVMTPWGELPLRHYAKGGIEHGPALSVHGEGSLPEANVPLQDGRTIPVTLSGQQAPVVNMPITIVNRSGTPVKARQERDSGGGMTVILDAVRSKLGSEIDNGEGLGSNIQNRFGLNNAAGLMR